MTPSNGAVIFAEGSALHATADILLQVEPVVATTISRLDFHALAWKTGRTQFVGSVTNPPYALSWKEVAAGDYLLTAKVVKPGGAEMSEQIQIAVVASTDAPTIRIISPAEQTVFSEPRAIKLVAEAHKELGWIRRVEFREGSRLLGEGTTGPAHPNLYFFKWTNVVVGYHTIRAVVHDNVNTGFGFRQSPPSALVHLIVQGNSPLPVVSVDVVDAFGSESGSGVLGSDTMQFRFARSGPVASPLVVYYWATSEIRKPSRSGSYESDPVQVEPGGGVALGYHSITIPAGAASVNLTMAAANDFGPADDDVIRVTLADEAPSPTFYLEYQPGESNRASAFMASQPWLNRPSIRLTSSSTNAVYDPGGSFHFYVEPLGWGEWLPSVEFFLDGALLQQVQAPPYVATVSNLLPGVHIITAKARSFNAVALATNILEVYPAPLGSLVSVRVFPETGLIYEDAGINGGGFIISRRGSLLSNLVVHYSLSTAAARLSEYQRPAASLVIPAFMSSAVVRVVPRDNP